MRRAVRQFESQDALAHGVRRNCARHRHAAGVGSLLIVEEVEYAVAHDLAAGGGSELVAHQGLSGNSRPVVKPRVSRRVGVAIKFIKRAMKLIRSALGDERDLTAGRPALVRSLAGYGNAEFLHGIKGNRQYRIET